MTNDELLVYARYHSRTDRALFSADHARRLCILGGREDLIPNIRGGFIAIYADLADILIANARAEQGGEK